MSSHYVYVYIDPRNYEEFYYGKGIGSRKDAHLFAVSDSAKAKRIHAIREAGLEPIVRVIARNLSEPEALLVEKTLLWKLGKTMTNVATGHFAEKFRPHNTMHKELAGFDYANGFYYYNVGEGPVRCWSDYVQFGFISAGQGRRWRDAMLGFHPGDAFAAYLKGKGFVGIGRIKTSAAMAGAVLVNGRPLLSLPLHNPGLSSNSGDPEKSEYVCLVDWVASVPADQAKRQRSPKLYTTTHVRASLAGQPETIRFLERAFGFEVRGLVA